MVFYLFADHSSDDDISLYNGNYIIEKSGAAALAIHNKVDLLVRVMAFWFTSCQSVPERLQTWAYRVPVFTPTKKSQADTNPQHVIS